MMTPGNVRACASVQVTASVTPSHTGSPSGVHTTPGGRKIVPARPLPSSSGKLTSTVSPSLYVCWSGTPVYGHWPLHAAREPRFGVVVQ